MTLETIFKWKTKMPRKLWGFIGKTEKSYPFTNHLTLPVQKMVLLGLLHLSVRKHFDFLSENVQKVVQTRKNTFSFFSCQRTGSNTPN